MHDFALIALTVGSFFNAIFFAYAVVWAIWWPLFVQGPLASSIWTVPITLALLWGAPFVIAASVWGGWFFYQKFRDREALLAMFGWMAVYFCIYLLVY